MVFEEIFETNKSISLIASHLQFRDLFGPYFEAWHKRRIAKRLRQESIFPQKFRNKLKKRKFLTYRFMDDVFTNPTTTIIYGENCLFIQWSQEPLAVKINNKEIARSHLNYFNSFLVIYKTPEVALIPNPIINPFNNKTSTVYNG